MNDQYISYEEYQKQCEIDEYNRACGMCESNTREEMIKKLKLQAIMEPHPKLFLVWN